VDQVVVNTLLNNESEAMINEGPFLPFLPRERKKKRRKLK